MSPYVIWYLASHLFLLLWARKAHTNIAEIVAMDNEPKSVERRTPFKYFMFTPFWAGKPHSGYYAKNASGFGYGLAGVILSIPGLRDLLIAILAVIHLGFFINWAITF